MDGIHLWKNIPWTSVGQFVNEEHHGPMLIHISFSLYLLQLFDLSYHSFVLALIYESIPRYVYIMAHSIHTTLWQKNSFNPWSRRLLCPGFFFGYTPRTTMEVRQVKVTESAAYHIRCLQAWHRKTICLYYVLLTSTYYIVVTYNNLTPMMHETRLLLMAQHKVPSNKLSYPSFFQTSEIVQYFSCNHIMKNKHVSSQVVFAVKFRNFQQNLCCSSNRLK